MISVAHCRPAAVFTLVFLSLALSGFAQDLTAVLSGTVTDASGAVVPGADVTVVNAATGVTSWRGTTNDSGLYLAPALPVGRYKLSFELPGFKKVEINNVNLQLNQRARVDVVLQPGEMVDSITVAGETAGMLETENSSIGEVINTSQVRNLPLPSRNVLNLLTLVGGVSSGGAATGINSSQLSINGSRTLNSEFTVDGVSVVSGSTGGFWNLLQPDLLESGRDCPLSWIYRDADLPRSWGWNPPALYTAPGISLDCGAKS